MVSPLAIQLHSAHFVILLQVSLTPLEQKSISQENKLLNKMHKSNINGYSKGMQ